MIISMDILKVIVMMCSTMSVEDSSGSWSEFKKIQYEQQQCRQYYYDCIRGNNTSQRLIQCDRERKHEKK